PRLHHLRSIDQILGVIVNGANFFAFATRTVRELSLYHIWVPAFHFVEARRCHAAKPVGSHGAAWIANSSQRLTQRVVGHDPLGIIQVAAREQLPAVSRMPMQSPQDLGGLSAQRYNVLVPHLHTSSRDDPARPREIGKFILEPTSIQIKLPPLREAQFSWTQHQIWRELERTAYDRGHLGPFFVSIDPKQQISDLGGLRDRRMMADNDGRQHP